jgi:hypothetical protein
MPIHKSYVMSGTLTSLRLMGVPPAYAYVLIPPRSPIGSLSA